MNSLDNIQSWHARPLLWPSLDPNALQIESKIEEEAVLIIQNWMSSEITSAEHSGMEYEMRKREIKAEPTYKVGRRTKITLRIWPTQPDPDVNQTPVNVETGFSDVVMDPNARALTADQLPEPYRSQFAQAVKSRSTPGFPIPDMPAKP